MQVRKKKNNRNVSDITARKQAGEELKKYREHLEELVEERTAELTESNRLLQAEIAERRKAGEELREEKAISETIIECLPGVFYLFDSQGRFLKWNRNFERVSGYSARELSGMSPLDFFVGEDKRLIEQRILEVFTKGESSAEAEFVSKDGRKTSYFFTGLMTTIDETKCLIGMGIDITEHKKVEQTLRESEEKYRSIFEGASDGIIAFDLTTGKFLFVNRRFSALTGYSGEEIMKLGVRNLHPEKYLPNVLKEFNEMAAGNKTEAREIPVLKKDGSIIYCDIGSSLLNKTTLLGFFRDVTGRKLAEDALRLRTAELEAVNRELEAFSYTVSHDLKTPLRSIEGFTRALMEDYKERLDETGRDYLNRVNTSSQRMSQLIEALLTLSRLTRGELIEKRVILSDIAGVVTQELRKEDPGRRVEFVIAAGVTAKGDLEMLRIVLKNLLDNAWKFTGKHPTAKIEFGVTGIEGKDVYFVRDDGAGFEMEYADKLFHPFRRLHGASEFPGIGIGLAIAHRIIIRHGGKIWAEAEPEKGATFYFTLE